VTVAAIATPSPKSESAVEVVSEPEQEDPEVTLRAKEQQLEEKMKVRHCKPLVQLYKKIGEGSINIDQIAEDSDKQTAFIAEVRSHLA